MAVTGHAGSLVNNSLPAFGQAVEEGGFSHVGASNYCYNIAHYVFSYELSVSIKIDAEVDVCRTHLSKVET